MISQGNRDSGFEPEPGSTDHEQLPDIVARIVETARKGRIDRLVVSHGDFHLELESASPVESAAYSGSRQNQPADLDEDHSIDPGLHVITSPMIGTFYIAPAPGEPPFVKPGDQIAQGDTVGIVEAMKIMNEIAADRAGTVVEIVAIDGETVEYGSPLVRIEP